MFYNSYCKNVLSKIFTFFIDTIMLNNFLLIHKNVNHNLIRKAKTALNFELKFCSIQPSGI